MPRHGLFITATGTDVGKTYVTRGLAHALRAQGHAVAAVKPLETDCNPDPTDAIALARACGRPSLAHAAGLYRVAPPLAPYAATLQGAEPPPPLEHLVRATTACCTEDQLLLLEGAGGLLVPVNATQSMADLAQAIALPLLLVAHDGLGVLSHTLTAFESARARGLEIAAVVLVHHDRSTAARDPSRAHNAAILAERLPGYPVLPFPACPDDDAALADAAHQCGLLDLMRPPSDAA